MGSVGVEVRLVGSRWGWEEEWEESGGAGYDRSGL